MHHPHPMRPARALLLAAGAALAVALTGCAPSVPATPTPDASAPAPAPNGGSGETAAELALFDETVRAVWDDGASVAGRDYVDALAGAGFEKDVMQVTADRTAIGEPADSLQVSVRVGDECLVGQVGPSIDAPVTLAMPGLPDGACLLGRTRPIDW